MTLFILPASTTVSNPTRLGYDNLLEQGTVQASSEDANYPAANAYDWLTCDFWRPTTSGAVTLTVMLPAGKPANYLAFYNHDLWKYGGSIGLQYYDGSAWVDATTSVTPADNKPRMVFFSSVTATQWRVVVTCNGIFNLGIVSFGSFLSLPYGMYIGWSPPRLARRSRLTTSMSDAGAFLGRSIIGNGIRTNLILQFAPDSWMDTYWLSFIRHAERKPFFFAPQCVKQPNDVALCWVDDDIPAPTHTHYGFMGANIPLMGVVE